MQAQVRALLLSQLDWFGHLGANVRRELYEADGRVSRGETLKGGTRAASSVLVLRRLVTAIDDRGQEIRRMLESESEEGALLSTLALKLPHDLVNSLLSEQPQPPIEIADLAKYVQAHLELLQPQVLEKKRSLGRTRAWQD